jgi:putative transposase
MRPEEIALIDRLISEYDNPKDVLGENGLLKRLTKAVVDRALQAEMTMHLGYDKHEQKGRNSGNSRNGTSKKILKTDLGDIALAVPRDRNGDFEPQIVRKSQRRIDGFDDKILALYARGMSTRDIQAHLSEIYGTEVSAELISRVTDEVIDQMHEWQNRPLEKLYTIVYLDAIWINVRYNGQVVKKAVYLVIGINEEGIRSVLGFWLHCGEGAASWMQVVSELQQRGVEDILIACVDGLKGLPEAVESVFPRTQVQLCIVHLIRNSLKGVSWKDRIAVASDLRSVYQAPNEEEALRQLQRLEDKWCRYPQVSAIWRRNWEHIIPMFGYAKPLRRVIYTTNAIEALNSSVRRRIRNKGSFPNDESAMKLVYLALCHHDKKGWQRPVCYWAEAHAQLVILFAERMGKDNTTEKLFTQNI